MTVGIIGLGLIGGSLALDLVERGRPVLGVDLDAGTRRAAVAAGIDVRPDAETLAAARPELVVVAVPPAEVAATVGALSRAGFDGVVTDVASVKSPAALGIDVTAATTFVGGHPMAGTERAGFGAARRGLLSGAPWLLTPHDTTSRDAFLAVVRLVLDADARPVVLGADEHDRLVAAVSHLPHLLAYAVHDLAGPFGADLVDLVAGPSFRDATRVAASDPDFWADVLTRNAGAVGRLAHGMRQWLDDASVEASESPDDLRERLRRSRRVPYAPERAAVSVAMSSGDDLWSRLRELGRAGYAIEAVAGDGAELVLARR